MKYFSELTNKYYSSENECVEAEEQFKLQEEKRKAETANISKEKKELSKAIEAADAEVDKAYELYEQAKEQAEHIISEANEKASALIDEASKKVKAARESKYKAIAEFNRKFGTYSVQYDDTRAWKELKRANDWINDVFSGLFW